MLITRTQCSSESVQFMKAAERGGIFVPPEVLEGNKTAQEFFLVTLLYNLVTDRPQWCLNEADMDAFRGRRMIIVGYLGNDDAGAKKQWALLKAHDQFGVMTNFENFSVSGSGTQHYRRLCKKLFPLRRLLDMANSIYFYVLAAAETLSATNGNWSHMTNGTLVHERMIRRGFQGGRRNIAKILRCGCGYSG